MKNTILFTLLLSSFQLWADDSSYYLLDSAKMACKPTVESRSILAEIPKVCADKKYYILAPYAKKDIYLKIQKSSCLIGQGSDLPINSYSQFSISGPFKEYTNANPGGHVSLISSENAYGRFEIDAKGEINLSKNIFGNYFEGLYLGETIKLALNKGSTYYPQEGAKVKATNYTLANDVTCDEDESLTNNSEEKTKERAGTFTYPAPERTNAR